MQQSCLKRADGNQQAADYIYDTTYFNYYYRLQEYNKLCHEMEERRKQEQQQNKSK